MIIDEEQRRARGNRRKPVGWFAYVIAGLSFIPLVGVLFGLISIVWGIVSRRAGSGRLIWIGIAGICVSIALYGSLFYLLHKAKSGEGVFAELSQQQALFTIGDVMAQIEMHKLEHGAYPISIDELVQRQSGNRPLFTHDVSAPGNLFDGLHFYYERVNEDHYYLLGRGPDGKPFTQDDVVPATDGGANSSVGLLVKGASQQ